MYVSKIFKQYYVIAFFLLFFAPHSHAMWHTTTKISNNVRAFVKNNPNKTYWGITGLCSTVSGITKGTKEYKDYQKKIQTDSVKSQAFWTGIYFGAPFIWNTAARMKISVAVKILTHKIMPIKLQNFAPLLRRADAQALIAIKQGIGSLGLAYLIESKWRQNQKK